MVDILSKLALAVGLAFAGIIAFSVITYDPLKGLVPKDAPTTLPAGQKVPDLIINPFGIVTARSASNITLKEVGGSSRTVLVTSQTEYLEGTSTPRSAAAVGDFVSIASSTKNSDGVMTAHTIFVIPPPPKP